MGASPARGGIIKNKKKKKKKKSLHLPPPTPAPKNPPPPPRAAPISACVWCLSLFACLLFTEQP